MCKITNSVSKHFSLQPLDEGIYAAIATDAGAAIGNSGLIELGGQVIVFDTCMTPQAATDLRRAAEELFGRSPQIVINSHYHNDHIWGNQVFASDAQIVSTIRTRELIATAGKEEFEYYSANSAGRLEAIRSDYKNSNDERQRTQLSFWISYYEGLVEALPNLKVCMPTVTFADRLEFQSGKRRAELLEFEGGHTGSDAVLYLSQEGVVFMSDLLFVGCHPFLADGDPLQWLKALREAGQFEATRFVPGHGQVGTRDDLRLMIEYVECCLETARDLQKEGDGSQERIAALKIPEEYQDWNFSKFFQTNIQFLCERLSSMNG